MAERGRNSYLIDRQSDPERLRRVAFEQFTKARRSGRLVAFLGSYASAHLGYPEWEKMIDSFFDAQKAIVSGTRKRKMIQRLRKKAKVDAPPFEKVVAMDLAGLLAGIDRHADHQAYCDDRREFMKGNFWLPGTAAEIDVRPNVGRALFQCLGITRFMTLNYDLELEWELMTTHQQKRTIWHKLKRMALWQEHFASQPRHQCHVAGRGTVSSVIVQREHSEILTEFALGWPWPHTQILHLHGRADFPDDLLITKRDYRDRYWQNSFSKLPFEYGLRLIFSGNPILFVGIGMKEPDVMRTIEQFLSDNPNRRAVPAFLLWDSSDNPEEDAMRRLTLYRLYGIHVLFDRDVAHLARCKEEDYDRSLKLPLARTRGAMLPQIEPDKLADARRLVEPLKLLEIVSHSGRGRHFWKKEMLRSPQEKYLSDTDEKNCQAHRIDVWLQKPRESPSFEHPEDVAKALAGLKPIKAVIGEPGSARGAVSLAIAEAFKARYAFGQKGRVILVNGSFAVDTDSIFTILSGAADGHTAQRDEISRVQALQGMNAAVDKAIEALNEAVTRNDPFAAEGLEAKRRVTIIINGLERFIAHDGSALSNELDNMIRMVIKLCDPSTERMKKFLNVGELDDPPDFPLNLILVGTERIKRYLNALPSNIDYLTIQSSDDARTLCFGDSRQFRLPRCKSYFHYVADCFGLSHEADTGGAASFDKLARRRKFFERVLNEKGLLEGAAKNPNVNPATFTPALCLEILRTLAFIGQPVEADVLHHVPKIWELAGRKQPRLRRAIDRAVADLKELGLALPICRFPPPGEDGEDDDGLAIGGRLGLHKALVAELRDRYGVPLSDARLSVGFNLSLTVAQPADGAAPELTWHDDLGKLVDFLMGSFQDVPARPIPEALKAIADSLEIPEDEGALELASPLLHYRKEYWAAMVSPETSACLRAALSILRSYYSMPALLMHANRDLDPWMRDGPLSEHAERLAQLLRVSMNVAAMRKLVADRLGDPERARELLGPFALYPDDLVWLNNELGVVRATQGDLYDADAAFEEAKAVNEALVECGDRQQNWRRIELNLVQVDIDQGEIEHAEERLRDLEAVIEDQAHLFGHPATEKGENATEAVRERKFFPTARDHIIHRFAREKSGLNPVRVDPDYPTDIILSVGLILGHRAQCLHLRGALAAAAGCFEDALAILLKLNEQRAYAYFQRHAAALHAAMNNAAEARKALGLCIAAAGASRQADIDHSGRVALVQYDLQVPAAGRPPWILQLGESLRYATAGDMFRLQLETMQSLAQVYLRNGDTDSALRYTNDAMAVAARCGFGLRTASLRILMAKILAFRGDLDSARELLKSASLIATKMKYERAVETAETELTNLGQAAQRSGWASSRLPYSDGA